MAGAEEVEGDRRKHLKWLVLLQRGSSCIREEGRDVESDVGIGGDGDRKGGGEEVGIEDEPGVAVRPMLAKVEGDNGGEGKDSDPHTEWHVEDHS